MRLNWNAILTGFVVTLVLGFVSGIVYAGTESTVFALSSGTIGIIGGLIAGFLAGGTAGTGAVHGGIATVFVSILLFVGAIFTTLLFAGIVPTLGVFVVGLLLLTVYALPGLVGGAIGSWIKSRRSAPEPAGVQA